MKDHTLGDRFIGWYNYVSYKVAVRGISAIWPNSRVSEEDSKKTLLDFIEAAAVQRRADSKQVERAKYYKDPLRMP